MSVVALGVVMALLAALWTVLHRARTAEDARVTTMCNAAVGRDVASVETDFTAASCDRHDVGTSQVTFTRLTSHWQSFACILQLDASGNVTRADVFRMTRQETWSDSSSPLSRLWPLTVPLTP